MKQFYFIEFISCIFAIVNNVITIQLDNVQWFNNLQLPRTLTVRDLLSWIDFVNVTLKSLQSDSALVHGAFLVLLDGICLGMAFTFGSTHYFFNCVYLI